MRCLARDGGRCSVLVAHRCSARAARRRAALIDWALLSVIGGAFGLLIGRGL